MRALAASSVLVYHVWLTAAPDGASVSLGQLSRVMPDLAFGVTLFFTLSGFLLYRPFAAAVIRAGDRPSFAAYLRNRALRIIPAYVVIILLSSFVLRSALVWNESGELVPRSTPGVGWLLKNLTLTQNYTPSGVTTGIGPAWSLAVEVVFYLTLPALVLLGALVAKRARTRTGRMLAMLLPPLVLLLAGLAGKATSILVGSGPYDGWGPDWNSVLERSIVAQADLFAFGMALAVVHVQADDDLLRVDRRARIAIATAAVGAYLFTTHSMTGWDHLTNSPLNTTMALACALFVAVVVLPPSSGRSNPIVRLLEARPFVLVGVVSYSVFLWHLPVILALREQGLTMSGTLGFFVNVAIVGSVTLALSALTYRFVEEPALRRKRRISTPSRPTGPQKGDVRRPHAAL